jgi:hypothetical protein
VLFAAGPQLAGWIEFFPYSLGRRHTRPCARSQGENATVSIVALITAIKLGLKRMVAESRLCFNLIGAHSHSRWTHKDRLEQHGR